MTAEERRKASGPLIGPRLRPRIAARQPLVRRSALRLPLWGAKTSWEAKTWPPVRSRQAFLQRDRRPGCEAHRGNAGPRRHRRASRGDERTSALFRHRDSGGGGPLELAKRANRGGGGAGLGALLSVQKDDSDEVASLICREKSSKLKVGV